MSFLSSGNNATLVDNCQNLQNLTVTLQVTQDLITLGNTGFSLQLNCYPQPASQSQGQTLNWFQYIIYVGGPINSQLGWEIQYWSIGAPSAWPTGYTPNPPNTTPWLPVLPNDFFIQPFGSAPSNQIPAGSVMQIQLATDFNGNVTTATFSVTDASGNVSSFPFTFPAGAVYPIYGFQVDVVGPGGGSACTFTSGAGDSRLLGVAGRAFGPGRKHELRWPSARHWGVLECRVRRSHASLRRDGEPEPVHKRGHHRGGLVGP